MTTPKLLLVEPVAKTPFPPLGLMKISSMLRDKYSDCRIYSQIGTGKVNGLFHPDKIYITSLFTWDLPKVISTIYYYQDHYPKAEISVGGIAATLMPEYIQSKTGILPHVGLYQEAEVYSPDYTLSFGRKNKSSITFTTRGCPRNCKFCSVNTHEPEFYIKNNWEKDINPDFNRIVFWDNNWLASPNLENDCKTIKKFDKIVDFNQGLDARLYTRKKADYLRDIRIDPIRFAFDNVKEEKHIVRAIRLTKKLNYKDIRVYALYNFNDTPEDFYYRINLLNIEGALAFPMEYRETTVVNRKYPTGTWNTHLLRGLRMSLLFYYHRGMITKSRKSFLSIYGATAEEFKDKLYNIYEYDKSLSRKRK